MRSKILAGMAILTVAVAVSCSDDGDGDNAGGKGGGGKGGVAGGSGGTGGKGGSGGTTPQGGSGGAPKGGSGGSGGAQGCDVNKDAFKQTFDTPADLWEFARTHPGAPVLSDTARGGAGKSMEVQLVVGSAGTADGGVGDAGTQTDAAAPPTEWFIALQNGHTKKPYIQAGRKLSVWLFVPAGHPIDVVQLGTQPGLNKGGTFTDFWAFSIPGVAGSQLKENMWNEITYTIRGDYKCEEWMEGFQSTGLYISMKPGVTWTGKIYVDDFEIAAAP